MKKLVITLAILSTAVAVNVHANPAIGPTISLGPGAVIQQPVQNDQRLSQRPVLTQSLYAAPQSLQRKGTHPGIDSETPVFRQRGPAGSMNLTFDIQLRPAF